MKKSTTMLGAAAIIIGAVSLSPSLVSAYQGNPNIQGPNYSAERHEAITQALDSGDYNTWKTQMAGKGPVNKITKENFARFAQAHKLALQGDLEGSRKIRAELGLGMKNGTGQKLGIGGQYRQGGAGQRNGLGQ